MAKKYRARKKGRKEVVPLSQYQVWFDSKLEWLAKANPEYHNKILLGESDPPTKWSYGAWLRLEEQAWEEWMRGEANNPDAPF